MKTVVLNVNDQVVDKLMWFLGHFNKGEIDVFGLTKYQATPVDEAH